MTSLKRVTGKFSRAVVVQSRIVTQRWQEASVSASDTEFPRNDKLNDTLFISAVVVLRKDDHRQNYIRQTEMWKSRHIAPCTPV